jgi:Lar family restriction alleviation protein
MTKNPLITPAMVRRAHAAGPVEYATEFDESFTRKILEAALAPHAAPTPPALLPCPFCGSAPKLIEIREMPDNFVREHNIRCDECAVSIYAEYESEVVEQWNNRPGSRIKTVLDALEALTVEHSPPSGISINEATRNKAKDLVRSALSSASTFEPIPIDDDSQPIKHPDFQARVARVHAALFDDDPTDIPERVARFFEEANEACQALGMSREDAHALVDYTYSRPIGEPAAELGAAAVTLTSLCVVAGHDLHNCAEYELDRLQLPETIERIKAKRSTRHGRGPLPGLDPAKGGDA